MPSRQVKVTLCAVLAALAVGIVFYVMLAGIVWQIRNPLGNAFTFWSNFHHALRFKAMPQYQERL